MALAAALTAQSTAITNVSVVEIETGRLLPAQTVVVTGNRITAMGPAARAMLSANPLTDIRNGAKIEVVIANGRVLDTAAREALFKAAEALAARPPS